MKVDLTGGRFDAVLFDLDGVLTDTARIHEASWKKMFDAFLKQRAKATGEPFRPFEGRTTSWTSTGGRATTESGISSSLAESNSRRAVRRIRPTGRPSAGWATARTGWSPR